MQKIIRSIIIVTLLATISSASEIVKIFNLKDNLYEGVTTKKVNRYKINDNLMLSMKLEKTQHLDGYKNTGRDDNTGFYELKIKNKELQNWVYIVQINVTADDDAGKRDLIFQDKDGLTFGLSYIGTKLNIGTKQWKGFANKTQKVHLKIIKINDKISYYWDEHKIHTEKKRFSSLKSIAHTLGCYLSSRNFDVLDNATLSEIK